MSSILKSTSTHVHEKLDKINYTSVEIELSPKLEEIIFNFNIQHNDEFTRGAKFEEIIEKLERMGLQYHPTFLLNTLRKMKDDGILSEVDEKWYSTMM